MVQDALLLVIAKEIDKRKYDFYAPRLWFSMILVTNKTNKENMFFGLQGIYLQWKKQACIGKSRNKRLRIQVWLKKKITDADQNVPRYGSGGHDRPYSKKKPRSMLFVKKKRIQIQSFLVKIWIRPCHSGPARKDPFSSSLSEITVS